MIVANLPHRPTVYVAKENAEAIARRIRDEDGVEMRGERPAGGLNCSMCNRKPPSGRLFEIRFGPDEGVRIGIDVCAKRYLRSALERLLRDELNQGHPDANRLRRIRNALTHV